VREGRVLAEWSVKRWTHFRLLVSKYFFESFSHLRMRYRVRVRLKLKTGTLL
jgi:hypothetical protein